jgi:hypothetical protein
MITLWPLYPPVPTRVLSPRAVLGDVEEWKFLTYWYLNSDPSVVEPVASRRGSSVLLRD